MGSFLYEAHGTLSTYDDRRGKASQLIARYQHNL